MRIRYLTLLFTLLSLSFSVNAEQAIYKSIGNQTLYGNAQIQKVNAQGFLVFDPDTSRITAIAGYKLNGLSLFSVVPAMNYRIEHLTGPNGSTYTILAKAESPGTQFAGTLLEAVYARGKDSWVTIDYSRGAQSLPLKFITSSHGIVHNDQNGVTLGSETTGSATLDVKASRASNLSESFDDAVARLEFYFISRGFTKFTPDPVLNP